MILFRVPDAVLGRGEAMRRREFIKIIAGSAAAWPFDAHAQGLVPIVGFATAGSRANQDPLAGFEAGLKEMGFVQGQNFALSNTALPRENSIDFQLSFPIWFSAR